MNHRILSVLFAGALLLTACGGDESVSVDQPWARATPAVQPNGAAYFELTVDHDDVLVGASVPSSVAGRAEIHEVVEADESTDDMDDMDDADESTDDMDDMDDADESMDDMADADDMGDMGSSAMAPGMVMREVDGGVALTADETVVFQPGGYHVMLLDLVEPLEVGDEFDLTLQFDDNDDVTIAVPVRETAP